MWTANVNGSRAIKVLKTFVLKVSTKDSVRPVVYFVSELKDFFCLSMFYFDYKYLFIVKIMAATGVKICVIRKLKISCHGYTLTII